MTASYAEFFKRRRVFKLPRRSADVPIASSTGAGRRLCWRGDLGIMRSLIATRDLQRHHRLMGRESTQHTTPDLFSTGGVRDASAASIKSGSDTVARTPSASQRHVLPANLDLAVRQLTDDELMQLLDVALRESKRRGKSPSGIGGDPMQLSRQIEELTQKHPNVENASNRKQVEVAEVVLSPGKLNAVRAAFKAGVTPSRIARQFGISQANVRKVLAAK